MYYFWTAEGHTIIINSSESEAKEILLKILELGDSVIKCRKANAWEAEIIKKKRNTFSYVKNGVSYGST